MSNFDFKRNVLPKVFGRNRGHYRFFYLVLQSCAERDESSSLDLFSRSPPIDFQHPSKTHSKNPAKYLLK